MKKCLFCKKPAISSLMMFRDGSVKDVYFCEKHAKNHKAEPYDFKVLKEPDEKEIDIDSFLPTKKENICDKLSDLFSQTFSEYSEEKDIKILNEKLNKAIFDEEFLEAARLRDKIKELNDLSS